MTAQVDKPHTWRAVTVNPSWEYGSSYALRCALRYRHGFKFGVHNDIRFALHTQIRRLVRGLAVARLAYQLYEDPEAANQLPIQPSYRVRPVLPS